MKTPVKLAIMAGAKMIKYKVTTYMERIERTEILRETKESVFFKADPFFQRSTRRKEQREAKLATGGGYFDTWEDAHTFLLNDANRRVETAIRNVERITASYERVKGMKE